MGHGGQDDISYYCPMLESDVRPTVVRQILSMHILITELKMGLGQVHARSVAT